MKDSRSGDGRRRAPERVRRADGQTIQLTPLLYRVLAGRPAFAYTRPSRPLPSDPYLLANLPSDLRHVLRIGLANDPRLHDTKRGIEANCGIEDCFLREGIVTIGGECKIRTCDLL